MLKNLYGAALIAVTLILGTATATAQPTEEEIIAAVDAGVAWLVSQQRDDGSWDDGYGGVGETGLACTKLMDYATDPERGLGLPSPFDDEYIYRDNVERCVNWLLDQAQFEPIGVQPAGDPDTSGNGFGVRTDTGFAAMYENGISLMALCNTVELDRTAPAGSQAGRTYLDIAQDMADYLYFCQGDENEGRGAWNYGCNSNGDFARADQSASGWVGFGFGFSSAGPPEGCGLDIPQFVLDELALYAAANQDPANGCANYELSQFGVFPWHNVLKQGHLLQILALTGNDSSSPAVQDAVSCMCDFYDSPDQEPGWNGGVGNASYQATYTAAKGLLSFGDDLKLICPDDKDWCADFDAEIVSEQQADGSWGFCNWGGPVLCTSWALLTLERAVPPPPGINAVIDIKFCSNPNGFNCKSGGVMPMTVFGSEELDVMDIDLETVQLCRADDDTICIGAEYLRDATYPDPDRGNPDDVGADQCAINDETGEEEYFLNPDGIPDLELAWEKKAVVGTLFDDCEDFAKGEASPTLVFKAQTTGGTNVSSTPVGDPGIDQVFRQK